MLKFHPFLTLNKSTYQITCNPPKNQITNLLCIVQTTQPSFQKLMSNLQCQVSFERKQQDYGIYISKEMLQNHHILYLDGKESKQIEDKYLSFFEKVAMALSSKTVFGDRSDYSRLISNTHNKEMELYMYLQTKNETYKISSINDNRLEIGYSVSMSTILNEPKQVSSSKDFLTEMKNFFKYPLMRQTKHTSHQSLLFEWIISAIELRKSYTQFKTSMVDKATSMFKKEQLNTLLSHIQSLSTSVNSYEQYLVNQFKQEVIKKNDSFKETLLQQVYQRYKNINALSYDQFKMEISVKFQLIKYSVDQYLPDSAHYANSILNRITIDFCQPLFTSLKSQLEQQIETKQCLTHEVDQQIAICESLKKQIERLNKRIDDMANIDEVLKNKDVAIRDLQAKADRLRSSEILLEGDNMKKQNLIQHLQEKLKQKNEAEKLFLEQISRKNQELSNLSKIFKQTQKEKQELAINLKKKTDESNQIRKIFHSAHEAKSVFEKKAESQQKCLNQLYSKLHDIKQAEKTKANMVISLNMAQHQQQKYKNIKLQSTIQDHDKKIVSLSDENRKLKIQINYFQKMFNQSKQKSKTGQPLIIIEENNQASTDRKRICNELRQPFSSVDNIRDEGQEWVNSSRKQCERNINSVNRLQIQEEKTRYF